MHSIQSLSSQCSLQSTPCEVRFIPCIGRFPGRHTFWCIQYPLKNVCLVDRLDYFIVGVTNTSPATQPPIRGSYPLCGQYPTTAVGGPLPVYCNVNTPPSRYVIIQQPMNGAGLLNICELEVYSELPYSKLYQLWFYYSFVGARGTYVNVFECLPCLVWENHVFANSSKLF